MVDHDSFHRISRRVFGSPSFYGENGNAWIDCLTYVHEGDGMSNVVLADEEYLFIHVADSAVWTGSAPDVYLEFLDLVSYVNQRSAGNDLSPRLVVVPL